MQMVTHIEFNGISTDAMCHLQSLLERQAQAGELNSNTNRLHGAGALAENRAPVR